MKCAVVVFFIILSPLHTAYTAYFRSNVVT